MAQLIEEIVVGNTAIKVKFLRTVRVSSITNDRFSLATSAATPVAVTNPFRPIEVSNDYNATSRTLILYFSAHLVPLTTYRFTVSGLRDANNAVIPDESIEFVTNVSTTPSPGDPVDPSIDPQPIPIEDYTVPGADDGGNGSNGNGNGSGTSDGTTPGYGGAFIDDFRIIGSDPSVDEPIIEPDHNAGRVTIKFSEYPAAEYVNSTYFKVQRKKMQREYVRWETVTTQMALDSMKPWVYVDFPSTDSTPVYYTAGKEYFPVDYKYRVRVSKDVAPDIDGSTGGNTLNLIIEQGATFQRSLSYQNQDGTPRDLTDYTAQLQISETHGGPVVLELTTENGGIVINGPAGQIVIEIDAAATAALTITAGVYDLEITSPEATPVVTRLLEGTVTVSPTVTA